MEYKVGIIGNPHLRQATGLGGIPSRVRARPSLGDQLHRARAASGLSIRQAATEAGISTGALSGMENGRSTNVAPERLERLAATYGIDPTPLYEAAQRATRSRYRAYLRTSNSHTNATTTELTELLHRLAEKYNKPLLQRRAGKRRK
ncbi:hypothetical protein GCM10027418_08590 [Mariniluteicoccus endophyticus]